MGNKIATHMFFALIIDNRSPAPGDYLLLIGSSGDIYGVAEIKKLSGSATG